MPHASPSVFTCPPTPGRDTEAQAIKENEGIVDDGLSWLAEIVLGPSSDTKRRDGAAPAAGAAAPALATAAGPARESYR